MKWSVIFTVFLSADSAVSRDETMDGWINGSMDGWMDPMDGSDGWIRWMDGWMDPMDPMDGWIRWMDGWMDG